MIDFVENLKLNDFDGICDDDTEVVVSTLNTLLPLITDNELTIRQKDVFNMYYYQDKRQTEIANLLHLSQPTVSRHLSTAKDIMNNHLRYCYLSIVKGVECFEKIQKIN